MPIDIRCIYLASLCCVCSLSALSLVLPLSQGVWWSGQQMTGLALADRVSTMPVSGRNAMYLFVTCWLGACSPCAAEHGRNKAIETRINDISFCQALPSPASLQSPSTRLPPTCSWPRVGVFKLQTYQINQFLDIRLIMSAEVNSKILIILSHY